MLLVVRSPCHLRHSLTKRCLAYGNQTVIYWDQALKLSVENLGEGLDHGWHQSEAGDEGVEPVWLSDEDEDPSYVHAEATKDHENNVHEEVSKPVVVGSSCHIKNLL